MAKYSTIPSAPVHATHCQHYKRDMHERFRPQHKHCFPKRPENGKGRGEPVSEPKDFPSTGTPDTLLQAHQQEEKFERSEQIAAAGHVVPAEDASKWIESEEDDWLDKDAAR